MSNYSLQRQPMERATNVGITMREIEAEVAGLYGDTLSAMQVRDKAFLFALLKQGSSLQKLQWFTGYEIDFIRGRVEALRAAGRLITNTPSTQYLQNQVAGCEALIERITGQRVVPMVNSVNAAAPRFAIVVAESNPKEESMHESTAVNGAAEMEDFQQTCAKTHDCTRKAKHTGMCTGTKLKTRRLSTDSPEQQRAANAERMGLARAKNKSYARAPKATTASGTGAAVPAPSRTVRTVRPIAAAAPEVTPCHFTIEFEDETETIKIEGSDRATFRRKLKSLYEEFAGE